MDRFDPCGTDECKKRCDSYGVACDDIMADEIDRLRAELAVTREPIPKWQPIDTAPTDGTAVRSILKQGLNSGKFWR